MKTISTHTIRFDFKNLSAEEQRITLRGLILEHAYYSALAGIEQFKYPSDEELDVWIRDGEKHRMQILRDD